MTAAGTVEVVDLSELDFEPDRSCEHIHGCDREASWLGVSLCPCAVAVQLCDEHKARHDAITRGGRLLHRVCGWEGVGPGVSWHPIGGAR